MRRSTTSLPSALSLALCATALLHVPQTAQAATSCAERDKVVQRLSQRFGEQPRSIGLGANNALVEVFASDETGTWTITVTHPTGMTCLIASGQAFETLAQAQALGPAL